MDRKDTPCNPSKIAVTTITDADAAGFSATAFRHFGVAWVVLGLSLALLIGSSTDTADVVVSQAIAAVTRLALAPPRFTVRHTEFQMVWE
jgi:hypothetical protein